MAWSEQRDWWTHWTGWAEDNLSSPSKDWQHHQSKPADKQDTSYENGWWTWQEQEFCQPQYKSEDNIHRSWWETHAGEDSSVVADLERKGSNYSCKGSSVPSVWAVEGPKAHRVPKRSSKGKEFNDKIISADSNTATILQFVSERVHEFSVVNAVTALHRLAKSKDASLAAEDPRMRLLNARIVHIFKAAVSKHETVPRERGSVWNYHVDTRALTNTVWAQAKMGIMDPIMLGHIGQEVINRMRENTAQQMANCAWGFAKLGVRNEKLLTAIAEESSHRIDEFIPQNLMCLLWAFAKLHFLHPPLMTAAAEAVIKCLDDCSAQHVSIIAWACATLGFRSNTLMDRIASVAMRTMGLFSPQNLANLTWAFATLDLRHEKLLSAISLCARQRLGDFNQQHMCNLAWAFSALQLSDEELMLAIADQVIHRLHDFNSQGLSNMSCAFAVLGLAHHEMFEGISKSVVARIHECTPRDLESIAWAFARLGMEKDVLMAAISKASIARIHEFGPMDLANMAWAYATLALHDGSLMEAIASEAVKQVADFSSQGLGHLAWSFSSLSCAPLALMEAISQQAREKVSDLEVQHVALLLDANLSCKDVLGRRMGAMIRQFVDIFPKNMDEWQEDVYPKFLQKVEIDNFGWFGTRFLLERLGIDRAPQEFYGRAVAQVHQYIRQNNAALKSLTSKDVLHKRVCSFSEYSFFCVVESGVPQKPVHGAMIRENGYWTASTHRGGKCRWLKAARGLKVGALVDRTLCSEFQTLEELCDGIECAGWMSCPERVCGFLRMFVSTTPCISCVGAMSQFLCMFRGISMEVVSGKIPVRQGWKKDV